MALRVFLDTSALFAGTWSAEGGARAILHLGGAGAVQLVVSTQMLAEVHEVMQRKAPELLGQLALLLATCQLESVSADPPPEVVDRLKAIIDHPGDIVIMAAAYASRVDYFVTHDDKHFLNNSKLRRQTSFPIGDPAGFLEWYRQQLLDALPRMPEAPVD